MTSIGVAICTRNPSKAEVAAQVAISSMEVFASSRMPPTPTLSTESIVASTTLGSRLNCITAIQTPPSAESIIRLRISYRVGCAPRAASNHAACGQAKAFAASAIHHPIDDWFSCNTEATHTKPSARPRVRIR